MAAFIFFLVMGRLSLPIIMTIGDNRLVYLSPALYGVVAALASGAPGPFWSSHRRAHDLGARSTWSLFLTLIAVAPPTLLLWSYEVSTKTIAPLVALTFAAAMVSTVLFGRTHAGYAGFLLTIVAMFTPGTAAARWTFGWIFAPQSGFGVDAQSNSFLIGASVGLLALGALTYAVFGELSDHRSAQ